MYNRLTISYRSYKLEVRQKFHITQKEVNVESRLFKTLHSFFEEKAVSAQRYSVKKKSKSELKGLETLILYV